MFHGPSRKKRKDEIAKIARHRVGHRAMPGRGEDDRCDRCALDELRGRVAVDEGPKIPHRFERGVRSDRLVSHFILPFAFSSSRAFAILRKRTCRRHAAHLSYLMTTSLHIYYLIDALCEFSKFFCRTPSAACPEAASRRGNRLWAKGLRRRIATPRKYFSGELSNWPNPALFETAARRNRHSSRGLRNKEENDSNH